MTDDIVTRLRKYADWQGLAGYFSDDLKEAADEIERLRAALRAIAAYDTDADGNWGFFRDEADAALREASDDAAP
jgi:hypothetical protein